MSLAYSRAAHSIRVPRLRRVGRRAPAATTWLAIASLVAACSGGTGPDALGPGLHVIATPSPRDTVEARVAQPLVVEVRGEAGQLRAGLEVRFAVETVAPIRPAEHGINLCLAATSACSARPGEQPPVARTSTGSDGRAAVTVRFATLSGESRVRITVPALGYTGVVTFTVLPGTVVRTRVSVADTVLRVGERFAPVARQVDRFGNPHPGAVPPTAALGAAVLQPDGSVAASVIGIGRVSFGSGGSADTMLVRVVPDGGFAALDYISSPTRVVLGSFDGRERRVLRIEPGHVLASAGLGWSPDGRYLLYGGSAYGEQRMLQRLDVESGASAPALSLPDDVRASWWGRYSPDGATIHFTGLAGGQWRLYRARADGTGVASIELPPDPARTFAWRAEPAADGRHVAYEISTGADWRIRVLDLVTGTGRPLDAAGQTPRISPDGRSIAFVSSTGGAIHVMNIDGTAARTMPVVGAFHSEGTFDWSPDGEWLLVSTPASLHLLSILTGEHFPLPNTMGFGYPAWRR